MADDKWETVSKPKSSKGSPTVKGQNGTKKAAAPRPMPRLEDVLPVGSLQSMYSGYEPAVQEVKKPEAKPTKQPEVKKINKDPPAEKKAKMPVNLSEAVKKNLRVDDIKQLIESCQTKFPDSPLLWLRDLAAYLSLKLANEDKSEKGIFDGSPLSALSVNMKKAIYSMVQGVPDTMKETYIETCIANTAHDLSKNLDVTGWMIMTQVLTDIKPSLSTSNLARLLELRNSYQNRPNVGLAILWSVGQGGRKDIHVGVRVWLEIMLPLLSMKHYTRFVVEYLAAILTVHRINPDTRLSKPVMDMSNFNTVQDTVFVVSNEYGRRLRDLYPSLRAAALSGCTNHELFPNVMERMKNQNMPDQLLDSLEILSECLIASPAALVHWHKLYTSHLNQSGQLLQYLNTHWARFKALGARDFQDTVQAFQEFNLANAGMDDVGDCTEGCSSILARISMKSSIALPWKTICLLLLMGTGALIHLDVQKNGTFKNSHTGHFLQDLGQYERTLAVWGAGSEMYRAGYSWADTSLPVYYAKAREVAGPQIDVIANTLKDATAELKIGAISAAGLLEKKAWELYAVAEEVVEHLELKSRCAAGLTTVQVGLQTAADKAVWMYQELAEGRVDWDQVRSALVRQVGHTQQACLQALDWAKQQIIQLAK